ncbi:MAG: hypothetical protein AAGF95_20950 [Chloroflexota bacterium]
MHTIEIMPERDSQNERPGLRIRQKQTEARDTQEIFVAEDELVEFITALQGQLRGDREITALRIVKEALTPLDKPTIKRILRWAVDRYGVEHMR